MIGDVVGRLRKWTFQLEEDEEWLLDIWFP